MPATVVHTTYTIVVFTSITYVFVGRFVTTNSAYGKGGRLHSLNLAGRKAALLPPSYTKSRAPEAANFLRMIRVRLRSENYTWLSRQLPGGGRRICNDELPRLCTSTIYPFFLYEYTF